MKTAALALADFLSRHDNVLLLTGAGISTASGIPGYRDEEGVRQGRAPIQGPEFRRLEEVRRRYWARSMVGWRTLARAQPNAGHYAVAELQAKGHLGHILTQNVDGLHQRAGAQQVMEMHGSIHEVRCLACGLQTSRATLQQQLETLNPQALASQAQPLPDGDAQLEPQNLDQFRVPSCNQCGGMLQPDVVFFGDNLPAARTQAILQATQEADALLVAGSSLMVYSGYRLCKMAAAAGKPIAAINLGKTRADDLLTLKVCAPTEQVLPKLATLV